METKDYLDTLAEHFSNDASVKNVYGEPITAQGKTIIPVAKVAMGLGGGYGQGNGKGKKNADKENALENEGKGAGAGGGMYATAKGVYEVTEKGTRYIAANSRLKFLVMGGIGFLLGRLVAGRKKNKNKNKNVY
jgi:uncharacterized spore protein YtfJ